MSDKFPTIGSADEFEEMMQDLNERGIDPFGILLVDARNWPWMAFGTDVGDSEYMSCYLLNPGAFTGNDPDYLPKDNCRECDMPTPYVPLETAHYPVTILWQPTS